jgi:hypothetical protein
MQADDADTHGRVHVLRRVKRGDVLALGGRLLLDAVEDARKEVDRQQRDEEKAADLEDGGAQVHDRVVLDDAARPNKCARRALTSGQ